MVQVRDLPTLLQQAAQAPADGVGRLAARHAWTPHTVERVTAAAELVAGAAPEALAPGFEITEILAELYMDAEGLAAGMCYRAVRRALLPLDAVRERLGAGVAKLIDGVLRMAIIGELRNTSGQRVLGVEPAQQTAKLRAMLVSMIEDMRVALLKIAERTWALHAVREASPERQRRVAREVFDIYAPLAHRLGIGHLKWELEDLAFRYLEPAEYRRIAQLLEEKRADRQHYIDEVIAALRRALAQLGKEAQVSGRPKHIYSIWKKMQSKGLGFSQIYDIRAVRVLVPAVSDCYAVLGIVHSLWRNIPAEFDDYIASPKSNGYRSLHTAVLGPGRRVVEIQIRTHDMHEEAEFGLCSHWRYKDSGNTAGADYEERIAWLRQVLEWHEDLGGAGIEDYLRVDQAPERIYVFTPEGHVVDLPRDATPLDFAYRVHTEIGHRCRGARVNGVIHPLNKPLETGVQVEIIAGRHPAPSRDWLVRSLGYLTTARARAKVRQWFRELEQDENRSAGQQQLERALQQLGYADTDLDQLASEFNRPHADALYEAIGAGTLALDQVVRRVLADRQRDRGAPRRAQRRSAQRFAESDFYIYGVGDLLTRTAHCCLPEPGAEIAGYLTHGRGVTIHRADCGNLLHLRATQPRRVLQVSWGTSPTAAYEVGVRISAYDRAGLLRDITAVLDEARVFILSLYSGETRDGMATVELRFEVPGMDALRDLMARLERLPNVVDVRRISD
ncbi:MAG: bifunctional (p)ppGpp synthetase/guanosine-3',5'-bis(diphosphate) 3'-pyrophosphohydrolase [Pseudomonadales bacterium]|nr:bifunctional (p)ppGpp synthetase/guanosine-3',5'-bis(diphosphate) 3'-pyrophosphohydrolase [Pseudomonadales bacterium]